MTVLFGAGNNALHRARAEPRREVGVAVDPVTLILTALAAGAAAASKDAASNLIKDTYNGLKALVLRRVAKVDAGTTAIEQHARDPKVWDGPARDALAKSGATEDPAVLDAAQALLEAADPDGARAGAYVVNITASGERSIAAHTIHGGASTGDK